MDTTETDGMLAVKCLSGDLTAFEALVGRHRAGIVRWAERRLRCRDDAEDVAQEAFVAAYFRLPQLREPDRFLPWLRTITDRLSLMRLRSRRETPEDPETLERICPRSGQPATDDPADILGLLPDHLQATVRLTSLEGYTYPEAAALLGISPGTVKSRMSRARAILREELGVMSEEEEVVRSASDVIDKLMERARDLLLHGEYEASAGLLDEILDERFEPGGPVPDEVVRMAAQAWEAMRRRDAEANARQYGRSLDELDWRVAPFNPISCSFAPPGGEGRDLWGVPREVSFLDARDICRRLRVSPVTLYRWVRQGMPTIRYAPWVRFDYARVQDWLRTQGIEPQPEVSLAEASNPIECLFRAIEAGSISSQEAERIRRGLDIHS